MAGTDTSSSLERRLATILSADVAGYSRLMAEDEEQTLQTFRGHREVFEKLVALHRGRVFNTAGDAILAEFSSAVEAVRSATEIQAALRTRNDQLLEHRQVKFRIGVNLGDVMVQGGDLLGDGVNVAARLQTAAEPGGICISGSVFDQIRNKLSLPFKPLGEVNFKNIPQAVRVFSIAEANGLGLLPSPEIKRSGARAGLAKWLAAAAALVVIVGCAGFWACSERQRNKAELEREARFAAGTLTAGEVRRSADNERQASVPARSPVTVEPPRTALAAPNTAGAANDGLYGGQICYGPSQVDPARCYRAQAIVQQGKVSGQWPGRDPGVTMHLAGDVSPSGDVTIHMHGERSDGSRLGIADLVGTLRDGRLDAAGSFMNGRSVSLNWRRN